MQFAAGMILEGGRHVGHRRMGVGHRDVAHPFGQRFGQLLADDRNGARRNGLRNKTVSVGRRSRHGEEAAARRDLARIAGQRANDLSRRIAGVIFEQMLQYQAIPAGDLAVVDFTADGVPFYGVLKLNYRPGYTHHTELMGNGRFSSMVPQRTLLPGTPKADEAALIDRANGTVRLIEKKFTLDDRKDFYLSTRVFGCTEALQEKAKLKAVCETAVAAVKEAYPEPEALDDVPPFDGGTETAVELLVRNQAVDNQISVEDVRERIRENFPLAAPRVEEALAETGVQDNDRVTVTPARIKKLESRSFKTESGIEIRIPAELCSSDDAVEFIHSATGGLSLLIKDVLV